MPDSLTASVRQHADLYLTGLALIVLFLAVIVLLWSRQVTRLRAELARAREETRSATPTVSPEAAVPAVSAAGNRAVEREGRLVYSVARPDADSAASAEPSAAAAAHDSVGWMLPEGAAAGAEADRFPFPTAGPVSQIQATPFVAPVPATPTAQPAPPAAEEPAPQAAEEPPPQAAEEPARHGGWAVAPVNFFAVGIPSAPEAEAAPSPAAEPLHDSQVDEEPGTASQAESHNANTAEANPTAATLGGRADASPWALPADRSSWGGDQSTPAPVAAAVPAPDPDQAVVTARLAAMETAPTTWTERTPETAVTPRNRWESWSTDADVSATPTMETAEAAVVAEEPPAVAEEPAAVAEEAAVVLEEPVTAEERGAEVEHEPHQAEHAPLVADDRFAAVPEPSVAAYEPLAAAEEPTAAAEEPTAPHEPAAHDAGAGVHAEHHAAPAEHPAAAAEPPPVAASVADATAGDPVAAYAAWDHVMSSGAQADDTVLTGDPADPHAYNAWDAAVHTAPDPVPVVPYEVVAAIPAAAAPPPVFAIAGRAQDQHPTGGAGADSEAVSPSPEPVVDAPTVRWTPPPITPAPVLPPGPPPVATPATAAPAASAPDPGLPTGATAEAPSAEAANGASAPHAAQAPTLPATRNGVQPPGTVDILLVEDDENVAKVYRLLLESKGHTVRHAGDGIVGLELAAVRTPELILLDVMMPRMNGILFLQALRERPGMQSIPVVILSNFREPRLVERALALGALEYVVKAQTRPDVLLSAIPRWVRGEPAAAV